MGGHPMTTAEAPPADRLMPSDAEIDAADRKRLAAVVESHGLPVPAKATAAELRPWARAVVHGARAGAHEPEPEGEPEPGPEPEAAAVEPDVEVPIDAHAVEEVETVELEPWRPREIIPDITVWERIQAMAEYLFKSSLRPATLKNVHDVGLVLLAAYDLGIPSSFAMQKIHVQNGRMGMMGELMSALILRDGHSLRADVANDHTVARVWGKRDGDDEWTWAEFTIEDATAAGLAYFDDDGIVRARSADNKKLPWELYTSDMLYWRALARLARRHFSDCLGGISYTPDELGWAIDAEAGDEIESGPKPFGRAGEPEPTMTIGRQRSELQNRLGKLPEDLQADIKEKWVARRYPKVTELSAAAIRAVRGWLEAAEEIAEERESTEHIPDATVVEEHTGEEPDPARSGTDGVEGSAAADRDAPEPSSVVEDRQEAGEPGPLTGDDGAVQQPVEEPRAPVTASPAPDAEPYEPVAGGLTAEDVGPVCAGCHEEIVGKPVETDDGPYHEDCAPM